jgi:putative radical SAM enzyme (TIGR03279 family)
MSRRIAEGVTVLTVKARSLAAEAGLAPGDHMVAINGSPLRDAIDFQVLSGEEELTIHVLRNGRPFDAKVQRLWGKELGLELAPPTPGEIQTCANKCVFCFIHQLPRGMRKSLYVKDDDFRLSFLHGNYITLTDLTEAEMQRIVDQRLSPLYISVHATDPELRHLLLGKPKVKGDLIPRMRRLAQAGIRMHAQIVLCPDLNDGRHLARSVRELAELHPTVATLAVVPVGLTRHRERLPALRPVTEEEARGLLTEIHGWQSEYLRRLGSRFVFGADELYILAGWDFPPVPAYEEFPVLEDGVGLARKFLDGWPTATRTLPGRVDPPRHVSVATGELFAPYLERSLAALRGIQGLRVSCYPIPNDFFGRGITVAGLLTGQDLLTHLSRQPLGDLLLVPGVALKDGAGVFLDDLAPQDLASRLGVAVKAPGPEPSALLRAILR